MIMGHWIVYPLLIQLALIAIILFSLEGYAKTYTKQLITYLKRQAWAYTVAYMVGIHNFYKEEEKTPEDIVIKIEEIEKQEDGTPKD